MQVLKTDYVLDNRWMKVRRDLVSFPTKTADFYTMEGPEWVIICAITSQKEILFVNQYRISIKKDHLELPAGKVDNIKDSPRDTAVRELREETGYELKEMHSLGTFNTIAGRSNVKGHLFCGLTGTKGIQHLDATEDVRLIAIPILEVMRMIQAGELTCLCSMATILLAKEKHPHLFQ